MKLQNASEAKELRSPVTGRRRELSSGYSVASQCLMPAERIPLE